MTPQYETAAQWLLIGFCKSWLLRDVAAAIGVDHTDDDALRRLHEACAYMPHQFHQYTRPVRAFVVSEWPKLASFLHKHEGNATKVLSVCDQVKRLKARGDMRGTNLTDEDMKEGRRNAAAIRHVEAANQAARRQQLSTQRSAWNVCKA